MKDQGRRRSRNVARERRVIHSAWGGTERAGATTHRRGCRKRISSECPLQTINERHRAPRGTPGHPQSGRCDTPECLTRKRQGCPRHPCEPNKASITRETEVSRSRVSHHYMACTADDGVRRQLGAHAAQAAWRARLRTHHQPQTTTLWHVTVSMYACMCGRGGRPRTTGLAFIYNP